MRFRRISRAGAAPLSLDYPWREPCLMRRRRPRPDQPPGHARRDRQKHVRGADPDRVVLLFGLRTVEAALANPRRHIGRLLATENAAHRLGSLLAKRRVSAEPASPKDFDRLLGPDAVHQGVAL